MIRLTRINWIKTLFFALYIFVSAATFRHSAHGFASLEGGSLALGALSALAIDVGMILSASGLRHKRNWALVLGLTVSAGFSTYTQLLYSVSHAAQVSVAPGALWLEQAQSIIDLRVVALPIVLPALSVIYAFSAKDDDATRIDADRLAELERAQRERDEAQAEVVALHDTVHRAVAGIEAFGLLSATQQAKTIASVCENGDRPQPSELAPLLTTQDGRRGVSMSTVSRGYSEAKGD